ncbi:MAG: GrpB family protein, partial [Verrucomicrobiota bacterium]
MHWLCKPSFAHRTHHVHLVPFQSPLWFERIRFRDYLRINPKIASEYSKLKKNLAKDHKFDREAYTDKKWPFIKSVLDTIEKQDTIQSENSISNSPYHD